ncbi:hypothetical protein K438DRAFT_1781312 [Mycena galopus ATCC 62051]|nr:hypothetical protein K438DRAFT_1781312 [Mycena galopus ATCC 62051]
MLCKNLYSLSGPSLYMSTIKKSAAVSKKAPKAVHKPAPSPIKPHVCNRAQTEKAKAQKLDNRSSTDSKDGEEAEDEMKMEVETRSSNRLSSHRLDLMHQLKREGGKKKVDAHWELTKLLLEENPAYTYKPAITAAAVDPKTSMKKSTRKHIIDLGQTSAGIKKVSNVDISCPNGFTNKWATIQETCPWFIDMWDLIAQRPNVIPLALDTVAWTSIVIFSCHCSMTPHISELRQTAQQYQFSPKREISFSGKNEISLVALQNRFPTLLESRETAEWLLRYQLFAVLLPKKVIFHAND